MRHAEHDDPHEERHQGAQSRSAGHVAGALDHVLENVGVRRVRATRRRRHLQDRGDRQAVEHAHHQVRPGGAEDRPREQQAGHRGTQRTRKVVGDLRQRDRVAAQRRRDQLDHEGLPGGAEEREHRTHHEGAGRQEGDLHRVPRHQRGQSEEDRGRDELADRDRAALGPAVGEGAAQRPEQEHRQALSEDHEAHRSVVPGQLERDDALYDRRHEERQEREHRAEPQHSEVPHAERREENNRAFCHRSFR